MEAFIGIFGKFWEHGKHFLWGCAGASVLVVAILVGGSLLGFDPATALLLSHGIYVVIAAVCFLSFAIARSVQDRQKPALFFSADESQSAWGHARQQDGEIITSLNISADVTNVSDSSYHVSKPKILRPLRFRWAQGLDAVLMTQSSTSNYVGQSYAIEPHKRAHVNGVIPFNGKIGKAGKPVTFVVSVVDHCGRRHKITFKNVRAFNQKDV